MGFSIKRGLSRFEDALRRAEAGALGHSRSTLDTACFAELDLELVDLGLSGRCFGPREYADALEERLGITIFFGIVDRVGDPAVLKRFAAEGRLAEARYIEHRGTVLINLPSNLPPFLSTLTAFHELAHVAAGDVVSGKRISRNPPSENPDVQEQEADRRSYYLHLAGSLGENNPYIQELQRIP